jgi:hypothetical protein
MAEDVLLLLVFGAFTTVAHRSPQMATNICVRYNGSPSKLARTGPLAGCWSSWHWITRPIAFQG